MASIHVIFAVVCLLALIHNGISLRCYTCGDSTPNCKDPFNPEGIPTPPCEEFQTECFILEKDGKIDRGCGGTVTYDSSTTKHYACKNSLCNSSSNIMPSFIITSVVAVIVAKIFK